MTVLDLCQLHYQNLLITCLENLIVQNANHAQKIIDTEKAKKKKKRKIEGLIEEFPSMYQFCNGNLNKFILLLRKGVYP